MEAVADANAKGSETERILRDARPKGPEDCREPWRTASRQKGRGSKGIGRRGPPLSVGELVVGYASRGAEVDHDL